MEEDENFDKTLFQAAIRGDVSTLQLMHKTDPMWQLKANCRSHLGNSALRAAAKRGNSSCVSFLIECGADINIVDVKAQTPLVLATKHLHVECMELLLQAGCDPDGDERNLMSPLYHAAMMGFKQGIEVLLAHGCDITFTRERLSSHTFSTPLRIAVVYNHLSCVRLMLRAGSEANWRSTHSRSLLHTAVRRGSPSPLLQLLFDCGANLYDRDRETDTLPWEIDQNSEAAVIHSAQYLMKLAEMPRMLKSVCRLVIRQMVGCHRLKHINELPLPVTLIEYLDLQDI